MTAPAARAAPATREAAPEAPVAAYKRILKAILDNRPSGARQRLAVALGKNRSFVSQITNPAYAVPVPAQHLETILQVCHATPAERSALLEAYRRAHPRRPLAAVPRSLRRVVLELPDLGSAQRNQALEDALAEHARRLVRLIDDTK
jgi:hypothetical protein